MNKIIHPIDIKEGHRQKHYSVFCHIMFDCLDNNLFGTRHVNYLSITGVEGPHAGGNAYGGCGQIDMNYRTSTDKNGWKTILEPGKVTRIGKFSSGDEFKSETLIRYAKGWDHKMFIKFLDVWEQYHLAKEIPLDVLDWLDSLPDTDKTPAWV